MKANMWIEGIHKIIEILLWLLPYNATKDNKGKLKRLNESVKV